MCFDIVVAKYNEDVSWISNYSIRARQVVIYDKSGSGKGSNEYKVINVANVGREAETFARYVVEHYHNLPDYVIFLQGHPFDHCGDLKPVMDTSEDFVAAGCIFVCDGDGNPHHPNLGVSNAHFTLFQKSHASGSWEFVVGAQHKVSRALIQKRSLDDWMRLQNLLTSNEVNPWQMERLWMYWYRD